MAAPGRRRNAARPVPHGYPEGPPPPNHPFDSPLHPAVDSSAFQNPLGGGSQTPLSTRAPVNISMGRRTALGLGGGAALGLAGLGLGVGLAEGVPAIFGAQGPINATVNPDKPKDKNDPISQLTEFPVLLLIGAAIVAFLVFK